MTKRIPWTAVVLSALVILTAGIAVPPIREVTTGAAPTEAFLMRPSGYVAVAPLSEALDLLTLLSLRQHIALIVGLIVIVVARRGWRAWRLGLDWRGDLRALAITLGALVLLYAAAALLPRPMASLELAPLSENADLARVDFHSHTSASHDGRPGWTVEDNRAWHRDAGYDVAYVTDHGVVKAAEQGMANNPSVAGDGVTILQGIEVTWSGEHVGILGAERTYRGLLTNNGRDVDDQALRLASLIANREPIVIWNHPHRLDRLPAAQGPRTMGVRGIEAANGAPDGMNETQRQRAQLLTQAQQRNLAPVAGSDNHGWGRAAPAWTLMFIENWRGMNADAIASQIENRIRARGFSASRVIERRTANPGTNTALLSLTLIGAPLRMLTTLAPDERIVWLVWTWLLVALVWWTRRRR